MKDYLELTKLDRQVRQSLLAVFLLRRETLRQSLIAIRNVDELKRFQGKAEEIDFIIKSLEQT